MTTAWPEVALGDVCKFNYGKSLPASERTGDGAPVFGSNGPVGSHATSITSGPTVVVGRKGSYGEVHYSGVGCWPIDTTYFIDEASTTADLRWLYYRLRSLGLTELNRAAAIPGLNRDDAYRKTLQLPPPQEQRRIAAILDAADELRAKRQEAVALLDCLTESIFVEVFGELPGDYPTVPLGALVQPGDRINYGVVQPGEYADDGVPLVRVSDLVGGVVSHGKLKRISPEVEAAYGRSRLKGSEVLVSCVGSIGVVALASESEHGFNVARAVARVPLTDSVSRTFVAAYLSTARVQARMRAELRTVAQPTLNIKQLSELSVPIPSAASQLRYEQVVQQLLTERRSQVDHARQLGILFASLQHSAFRGEL